VAQVGALVWELVLEELFPGEVLEKHHTGSKLVTTALSFSRLPFKATGVRGCNYGIKLVTKDNMKYVLTWSNLLEK
jgi:hypothetical protein